MLAHLGWRALFWAPHKLEHYANNLYSLCLFLFTHVFSIFFVLYPILNLRPCFWVHFLSSLEIHLRVIYGQ